MICLFTNCGLNYSGGSNVYGSVTSVYIKRVELFQAGLTKRRHQWVATPLFIREPPGSYLGRETQLSWPSVFVVFLRPFKFPCLFNQNFRSR
jgi:hypothetical protein